MEAWTGIEPVHKDFADPRLTTWLPRLKCAGNVEEGGEDVKRGKRAGGEKYAGGATQTA